MSHRASCGTPSCGYRTKHDPHILSVLHVYQQGIFVNVFLASCQMSDICQDVDCGNIVRGLWHDVFFLAGCVRETHEIEYEWSKSSIRTVTQLSSTVTHIFQVDENTGRDSMVTPADSVLAMLPWQLGCGTALMPPWLMIVPEHRTYFNVYVRASFRLFLGNYFSSQKRTQYANTMVTISVVYLPKVRSHSRNQLP